jgi:hypothetical protein
MSKDPRALNFISLQLRAAKLCPSRETEICGGAAPPML